MAVRNLSQESKYFNNLLRISSFQNGQSACAYPVKDTQRIVFYLNNLMNAAHNGSIT